MSYPQGKLNEDDEGEMEVRVGSDITKGVVIIEYAKTTKWVAMGPRQALELAETITRHAKRVERPGEPPLSPEGETPLP